MLNATDCFNNFTSPIAQNIEVTRTELFNSLQSQILDTVLYPQFLFLALVIGIIRTTDDMAKKTQWQNIFNNSAKPQDRNIKILNTLAYISLMPAIYTTLLSISIITGLNL